MNPTRERLFPPLYNNVEKRQEFQTNSRPPLSGFKGDTFAASSHCATHAAVNEQKYRADLVEGNRDLQLYLHGSLISDCSHRREQKFLSDQKGGKVHFYRTKRMLVIFESNELQSSLHDIDSGELCFPLRNLQDAKMRAGNFQATEFRGIPCKEISHNQTKEKQLHRKDIPSKADKDLLYAIPNRPLPLTATIKNFAFS